MRHHESLNVQNSGKKTSTYVSYVYKIHVIKNIKITYEITSRIYAIQLWYPTYHGT